jgi:hypothetical protein
LGKKVIGFSGEKLEKRSENGKKNAAPPPTWHKNYFNLEGRQCLLYQRLS